MKKNIHISLFDLIVGWNEHTSSTYLCKCFGSSLGKRTSCYQHSVIMILYRFRDHQFFFFFKTTFLINNISGLIFHIRFATERIKTSINLLFRCPHPNVFFLLFSIFSLVPSTKLIFYTAWTINNLGQQVAWASKRTNGTVGFSFLSRSVFHYKNCKYMIMT